MPITDTVNYTLPLPLPLPPNRLPMTQCKRRRKFRMFTVRSRAYENPIMQIFVKLLNNIFRGRVHDDRGSSLSLSTGHLDTDEDQPKGRTDNQQIGLSTSSPMVDPHLMDTMTGSNRPRSPL